MDKPRIGWRSLRMGLALLAGTALLAATSRVAARGDARRVHRAVLTLATPIEGGTRIARGSFRMGSTVAQIAADQAACRAEAKGEAEREAECPSSRFADEWASHEVTLPAFLIDRTEVTVRDYERCVQLFACEPQKLDRRASPHAHPEHPVTLVTWDDAEAYCRFAGGRLPTEAEWERAASGMSGRRYPWGNVFDRRVANHGRAAAQAFDALDDSDGYAELAPVGSFVWGKTNEGVYDLGGNVAEWVADWYAEGYPDADAVEPRGPAIGTRRVVRGGSYRDGALELRAAARAASPPTVPLPWLGFRCARSAE